MSHPGLKRATIKPLLVEDPNRVLAIRTYWAGPEEPLELDKRRLRALKALLEKNPTITEGGAKQVLEQALEMEIDERFIAGMFSDFIQDHTWAVKHSLSQINSFVRGKSIDDLPMEVYKCVWREIFNIFGHVGSIYWMFFPDLSKKPNGRLREYRNEYCTSHWGTFAILCYP